MSEIDDYYYLLRGCIDESYRDKHVCFWGCHQNVLVEIALKLSSKLVYVLEEGGGAVQERVELE